MSYKEYLTNITTLIFDVDGVLTDGTILVATNGDMFRKMHTKDGYVLKHAVDCGYHICIISGGNNEGVRKRLNGLGIEDVYLGVHHKMKTLETYLQKKGLKMKEVMYMGDDIPDLEVMQKVGLACCPQDAVQEIKKTSHYVSHKKGGKGCVRDVVEQILKVQNNWLNKDKISAQYD